MKSSTSKYVFYAFTIYFGIYVGASDGLRILGLFPWQPRSHFVMGEALMKELAAKGHQVDVYSHYPLEKSIPNYKDFSLRGTLPASINNLSFDDTLFTPNPIFLKKRFSVNGRDQCKLMEIPLFQKLLHDPPKNPPYDLVINELSFVHCYIPWGRHLNVPIVAIVTPAIYDWMAAPFESSISLATDPNTFTPYAAPMSFFERLDNVITFHNVKRIHTLYTRVQDEYIEKIFGSDYSTGVDLLKDVSLVLVSYDMVLSGIRTFPPKVVPVSGLHIVDHNEVLPKVQKWLDESKDGCIYFSFGSMVRTETFPKHILKVFYDSFKNIAPVRVLLKIGKPEELPPGLPSNVMAESWLHQIQVLKHKNVKVFVTHAGLMGTQESIYYGVPMIVIPLFADQYYNANAYVKLKIAIKINHYEISEETFSRALNEILKNPEYKKTIENISVRFKDRPMSPMDTAVFWIEYISRHGKDALKSPAADIPWWQASLLDVYAFIVTSVLLVLYAFMRVIKKLINLFSIKLHFRTVSKMKKS